MAQIISPIPQDIGSLFTVNFKSVRLTAAQFEQLCSDNRDLRLELTFAGELIVMPPAGSKTGLRNARLNQRLTNWADIDGKEHVSTRRLVSLCQTVPNIRLIPPGSGATAGMP